MKDASESASCGTTMWHKCQLLFKFSIIKQVTFLSCKTQKDKVCVQEKLSLQNKVELRTVSVSSTLRDQSISGYTHEAGVSEKLFWKRRLERTVGLVWRTCCYHCGVMWQEQLFSLAADIDLVLALVHSWFLSRDKDTTKQNIQSTPPKNTFNAYQIESTL